MAQKVLLVSDRDEWLKDVKTSLHLSNMSIECEETHQNTKCQKLLEDHHFRAIFMDPHSLNGQEMEILKFIKLNYPGLRISYVYCKDDSGQETSHLSDSLKRIGILSAITLPVVSLSLESGLIPTQGNPEEKFPQEDGQDKDFTAVSIENFSDLNIAIFDYYLRIKDNHFVKLIKKDDVFDKVRISSYHQKGVKSLFLKNTDRHSFIKTVNEMMKVNLKDEQISHLKASLRQCSSLSEMLIEELHSKGINQETVEESKKFCDNVASLVRNNPHLEEVSSLFLEMDPRTLSHSFLVTFISVMICRNLDWAGPKTVDSVAMGALLHDLGMALLPKEITNKNPKEMTLAELAQYEDHSRLGADLLLNNPYINPQVTQIVYQHHENNSGNGFPNRIAGIKIYPLAKIVSLAESIADSMKSEIISPLDAVKMLLQDRERVLQFDPAMVKSLVNCFTTKGKK